MRPRFAASFVLFLLLTAAPVLADSLTHSVQSGDSLWTIADRYGVSVSALEARNHLTDSSILQLGQSIIVPVHVHHASPVATHSVGTHRSARNHSASINAAIHAAQVGRSNSARRAAARAVWAATHVGSALPDGDDPSSLGARILMADAHITRTAMRFLGVPYMWGGTGFSGVDCSGFVQSVFAKNGIQLPRMADEQFSVGRRVAVSLLVPGDLVFFETYTNGASHVGIYIGNGRFIHASTRGVVIDELRMAYYASRYIGARRLVQ